MARNEVRHMEAVVAIAEELSFSRASQRLRISQPALTKQIADLESRFMFTIFERDSQAVSVTDAGRAYIEHARLAILHSERAIQSARAVLANAETVLRIGKEPYGDPFLVSTLLSLRLPLFPRLKVELVSGFSRDLVHGLLLGQIDLALVTEPPDSAALSRMKIAEEPLYVVLSEENPLADCPELRLNDLDACPWVLFAKTAHSHVYESVLRLASERDTRPGELHEVLVADEAYPYVVDRNAIALFTKSAALRIARDGITIRPLAEPRLCLKSFLASRADNQSKAASEMVRAFGRRLRPSPAGS